MLPGRGSVFLWRRYDITCTSGGIIFARNGQEWGLTVTQRAHHGFDTVAYTLMDSQWAAPDQGEFHAIALFMTWLLTPCFKLLSFFYVD